jgi:hypothetical protein
MTMSKTKAIQAKPIFDMTLEIACGESAVALTSPMGAR